MQVLLIDSHGKMVCVPADLTNNTAICGKWYWCLSLLSFSSSNYKSLNYTQWDTDFNFTVLGTKMNTHPVETTLQIWTLGVSLQVALRGKTIFLGKQQS